MSLIFVYLMISFIIHTNPGNELELGKQYTGKEIPMAILGMQILGTHHSCCHENVTVA